MPALLDPVRFLTGVGPEMARRLARLEIHTLRDLLFHLPRSYRDRRAVTPIAALAPNAEASILATLSTLGLERRMRGRRDVAGVVRDDTGALRVIWFNQPHVMRSLKSGGRYFFSGSVQPFRGLEMQNPECEPADEASEPRRLARVLPLYALTQGVSQRWHRA
ncbi:MAG: DNA helicase RecG, partial [Candidatus Rokubacteria bacterium]|nr:DNA helicase RecG [Candidatus Rokubacteria bacterium]